MGGVLPPPIYQAQEQLRCSVNPPLLCPPVIAVSLICLPGFLSVEKKQTTKKAELSNHLAQGLAFRSLHDDEQMKSEALG